MVFFDSFGKCSEKNPSNKHVWENPAVKVNYSNAVCGQQVETENTKFLDSSPLPKLFASVSEAAASGCQVAFIVAMVLKTGCALELPGGTLKNTDSEVSGRGSNLGMGHLKSAQ